MEAQVSKIFLSE